MVEYCVSEISAVTCHLQKQSTILLQLLKILNIFMGAIFSHFISNKLLRKTPQKATPSHNVRIFLNTERACGWAEVDESSHFRSLFVLSCHECKCVSDVQLKTCHKHVGVRGENSYLTGARTYVRFEECTARALVSLSETKASKTF